MKRTKVLVLFSGGIDSMAVAHFYKKQGCDVKGLHVNYGQASLAQESKAARAIAKKIKISVKTTHFRGMRYECSGELRGRNALFLLLALMQASKDTNIIALGIHKGTSYFDCGPAFVRKIQKIFDGYTGGVVQIGTPFINWSKGNIWDYCRREGIPLRVTYSCELGRKQPCNKCLSCSELKRIYAATS